jgi:hypothetical protein
MWKPRIQGCDQSKEFYNKSRVLLKQVQNNPKGMIWNLISNRDGACRHISFHWCESRMGNWGTSLLIFLSLDRVWPFTIGDVRPQWSRCLSLDGIPCQNAHGDFYLTVCIESGCSLLLDCVVPNNSFRRNFHIKQVHNISKTILSQ